MPLFCTPQPTRRDAVITPACYLSPGCHRQYRHICWSSYECSQSEVSFREGRSKNRVRERRSAGEGTGEGDGRNASWRRKHPTFPLFLTLFYLAAKSGFTTPTTNYVTERPEWRNLLSDSTIQVTVITLLSSLYCHKVIVSRLVM
jgi:hypothetical protein